MFLVPEVLWSPVGNIIYEFMQSGNVAPLRDNFLLKADNLIYFHVVSLIQLVGLVLSFISIVRIGKKSFLSWLILVIISCLVLINLSILYSSFALSNISF